VAGIYGIFSKNALDLSKVYKYFHSFSLENTLNEEYQYKNFLYGRSVINKFLDDRVLYEDSELVIGFEGLMYNTLEQRSSQILKTWYQEYGIDFVEKIKGQFCGFIYDKKNDKLFIYNDHLSSKPLYYYHLNGVFIFASELKVITSVLSTLSLEKKLDYDAVYSLLTFGYMLNDISYEKNTKKLNYATVLSVEDTFELKKKQYFKFEKKQNESLQKQEIIEKIDSLILKSVQNCWSKDTQYGYNHYASLSGGLDSRVNLFLAKELGYEDVLTMTFSQSNSSDDTIAQEIASKEGYKHLFYSLDNGKFLENNIKRFVQANDGLNVLTGVASGYDFLSSIDHSTFGGYHTGQIGDLLFGSYVKERFSVTQGIMSDQNNLLEKISFIESYKQKYKDNSEIFGYEQRVINGTFNGDRSLSHILDQLSIFYDKELIEFCLSIPDRYKKDEAIYLDWFNQKHKNISKYIWESAGVKPKNIKFVKFFKQVKRYKNALFRRAGFNINDMNPFDVWLRKNTKILANLDEVYEKYIPHVEDKELQNTLKIMYEKEVKYSHYGRNNKFLVITLLLAMDLHFGERT